MKHLIWGNDDAVNDSIDPKTGLFVDDTPKVYWSGDDAVNDNIDSKTGLFVDDTPKVYWGDNPF